MINFRFINDPKFGKHEGVFGKHEGVEDDKYILLGHFVGQFRFPDNIQEIIDMLESVRSGSKTWLEANDDLMFLQIGYDGGDFKCDKDTAYFIAGNSAYQNMEMPLQELIDIMKNWKIFMS